MDNKFEDRKTNLKTIRDKLLRFHKILMDADRAKYEREFGQVSPGKFLELLLSDKRFEWLRVISTLIVRIDETFDLDDGVSSEMIEGFYTEISDIFDNNSEEYTDFKEKLVATLPNSREAESLKDEIMAMI